MKYLKQQMLSVIVIGFLAFAGGCEQATDAPPVTTDMHEDFEHDHKHIHGKGHDHEHEHADKVEGAHSHPHTHGHRHGEPLHGGDVVSIGHTHHKDGESHFHAEIMPVTDGRITFYIQSESTDGKPVDFAIKAESIPAYLSEEGAETALSADEVAFKPLEGKTPSAAYTFKIPDGRSGSSLLKVMIPKIAMNGNRFSFSFMVKQKTDAADSKTKTEDKAESTTETKDAADSTTETKEGAVE